MGKSVEGVQEEEGGEEGGKRQGEGEGNGESGERDGEGSYSSFWVEMIDEESGVSVVQFIPHTWI